MNGKSQPTGHKENPEYYSPDRVRLSEQGTTEMFRIISDMLMNKTE